MEILDFVCTFADLLTVYSSFASCLQAMLLRTSRMGYAQHPKRLRVEHLQVVSRVMPVCQPPSHEDRIWAEHSTRAAQ